MARHTRLTVYVDAAVMDKPDDLYDAVFKHMIKKDVDVADRKKFMAGFMKTHDTKQVEYINTWVVVRDIATYPFRDNKKGGKEEEADG